MKKGWIIISVVCLIVVILWIALEQIITSPQDNVLLALVFEKSYEDALKIECSYQPEREFTVVSPKTFPLIYKTDSPQEIQKCKRRILEQIKIEGYNIEPLIDLLFARNKKSAYLTLKSSPENGYIIDYFRKYDGYFENDGGGWEKWYKENPKAQGITFVSLPAYDPKNHIFIISRGIQVDWLAGVGYIIIYKYENGKLKELTRVRTWIS